MEFLYIINNMGWDWGKRQTELLKKVKLHWFHMQLIEHADEYINLDIMQFKVLPVSQTPGKTKGRTLKSEQRIFTRK